MTSRWQPQKEALAQVAREMARQGLVVGSSGNASLRLPSEGERPLFSITPRGRECGSLSPDEMAVLDFDLEQVEGDLPPSSETLLHLAIYRARPDVWAVMHTHPVSSTALAVPHLELPPVVDELTVLVGGPVAVAQYGFPGTEELAAKAVKALGERNAVLLRHHGLVAVGQDPQEALEVSLAVERAAQVYIQAHMMGKVNPSPRK